MKISNNRHITLFCSIVFVFTFFNSKSYSQNNKKPLDFSIYDSWNYIEKQQISNDGRFVSYELNPYKGNGELYFVNSGKKEKVVERAYNSKFSPNSNFSVFKIKNYLDTVRALKIKKVKKDKLPKDSLGIYIFKTKKVEKIARVKSFKLPEETSDWFVYQLEKKKKEKTKKDTAEIEEKKKDKKKKKKFDKNAPKVSDLVIYNPTTSQKQTFKNVSEYNISRNGKIVSFIKLQNDTILNSTVFIFNTLTSKLDSLKMEKGLSKKITPNNSGTHFSYIHSADTIKENKVVQIGNENIFNIRTVQKGNNNTVFGVDYRKYQMFTSWDSPGYKDYYTIDLKTGKKKLIYSKTQNDAYLSSAGKYILKYSYADSSWYSYNIKTGKEVSLTKGLDAFFYDFENDYPRFPRHRWYGGWTENDKYVLIYDYYDIWKIDPTGKMKAVNLTKELGKNNKTVFRYIETDKEADFINTKKTLLLSSFNKNNKKAGFYTINFKKVKSPKLLISGDNSFNKPIKSKMSNKYVWTKSSCTEYPNLWYSNTDFTDYIPTG